MAADDQSKPNHATMGNDRKKQLRSIGHMLNPVVTVAHDGLTEGVLAEINRALDDHELIKIRIALGDRKLKQACIEDLCKQTGATLVQTIGNIALVLRENKKPNRRLSNLLRTRPKT